MRMSPASPQSVSIYFFFSSRRRHTRYWRDWSSDVCSSDLRDEERALARDVLARKLDVAAELHAISSCHTCATGEPWPRGGYDGGDCCAGRSEEGRVGEEGRSRGVPYT